MSLKKLLNLPCFLVLILAALSCGESIEIMEPQNNLLLGNPLKVRYAFKTNLICDATFTYWPKDDSLNITQLYTSQTTDHEFILTMLRANTTYGLSVKVKNGLRTLESSIQYFTTGRLPEYLPEFKVKTYADMPLKGHIALRKTPDPGCQVIINNQGGIEWFLKADTAIFRPFSITGQETILAMSSAKEIVEVNVKGDTLWNFDVTEQGFDKLFHHEVIENLGGQVIALTHVNEKIDLTKFGGMVQDTIKGDGIVVIGKDGNIGWQWNIFDHQDPLTDESINEKKGDWSHANALAISPDGHYLVSFRNFDQIWKIDSGSGEIIWKLGVNGDFQMQEADYFYKQHAVHINPFGDLMLFDNMGTNQHTSRALAFKIDEENHAVTLTMKISLPDSLFTSKQGSAYVIEGDKVLFSSPESNTLIITDLTGNILWLAECDQPFYRAVYMP